MKNDLRSLVEEISVGTAAEAARSYLEPALLQMRDNLFSRMAGEGRQEELLRLSGAAMVVETLLNRLEAETEQGKAALQQINRK